MADSERQKIFLKEGADWQARILIANLGY